MEGSRKDKYELFLSIRSQDSLSGNISYYRIQLDVFLIFLPQRQARWKEHVPTRLGNMLGGVFSAQQGEFLIWKSKPIVKISGCWEVMKQKPR